MGSDYDVLCTSYLVSVCVHCLVLKNTFQNLYQFVLKYKIQEAPTQLGPTERAVVSHLSNDREQHLTPISSSSQTKGRGETSKVGSQSKSNCPCARYEGIYMYIYS